MTVKVRFTAKRVNEFSCTGGKQQSFLWDSACPGLGLRQSLNGKTSFIFQSRYQRKSLRITIGSLESWSIPQAQEKAREFQRLIDQGMDPRQQVLLLKRQAREREVRSELEATVFQEVWGSYICERRQFWSTRHYQDHVSMTAKGKSGRSGVLFPLLNMPLRSLDAKQVERVMEREAGIRPARARLALRQLRAFLKWCSEHESWSVIVIGEAASSRRAREVVGKARAKSDHLEREQLHNWFTGCRHYPNPVISAYLQCLLLTGARREELALLTWENVDFHWHSLTIRDKCEGERTIPLTPYVESLIRSLPKRNEWVFSSPSSESGRLVQPSSAHRVITDSIGVSLTLHGLRRSFKSLSEWLNMPVGVVAQIMGHKPSATAEKHYTVRPINLLRIHHERLETWILEQAEVIPVGGIDPRFGEAVKPVRYSY